MSAGSEIDEEVFKAFERDGYSEVAEKYAAKTAVVFAQSNPAILDAARVKASCRVLDVACGPGLLTADAAKRGAIVSAIDFAPNMVAAAQSRNFGADIREGDAENLPFDGRSFDAVVCSLGVLHFPRPESAASEAFRVLDGDGFYAFTTWTPPDKNKFMGLILGSIQSHGTMDVDLRSGSAISDGGMSGLSA